MAVVSVDDSLALDAFLRGCKVDPDRSIRGRRSGECRDFKGVERLARISVSEGGQMQKGVIRGGDISIPKAAYRIRECALEEG